MRLALSVALAVLVLLAGCTMPSVPRFGADERPGNIGVENGYRYDDPLPGVNASDGLTREEMDAVKYRTMARVEHIRGLEFERDVPLVVISRSEYRSRGGGGSATERPWDEQFWEATFIVDERTTVSEARGSVYGATVQGFYNGSHIVMVSNDPDALQIDRGTLAHELVHALQHQHFTLATCHETYDCRLGGQGIVEGDPNYVEYLYEKRCEGSWSCVPKPGPGGGGGGGEYNRGLFVSIFTPYSEGPTFVKTVRDRGGWDAVNDVYDEQPESTEQVLHPEAYPDEDPVDVTVRDRSTDEWERFEKKGGGYRRDTVGEATLFTMLWYNGVVDEDVLFEGGDLSPYDYTVPATSGWGGDVIVPYTNGEEYGYVFKSRWDSERDAVEFRRAYLELLRSKGGEEVEDGVYVLPEESGYGDAFRVVRRNATVLVVNAPTVDELDAVHEVRRRSAPDGNDESPSVPVPLPIPGFTTLAALAAVLAAVLAWTRRR